MARSDMAIPSAQFGQDVTSMFHNQTEMPRATDLEFPDMVGSANAGLGAYATGLTPTSLNQRLPSMINDTPEDVTAGAASTCEGISQWVNDNPMPAVGVLVALAVVAFMPWGKVMGGRE